MGKINKHYNDVYDVYFIVQCPVLTHPMNGGILCTLMNGMTMPFYEDTCSYTCNAGYELTGSNTRTCQNDGSWSGNETMCVRGTVNV